MTGDFDLVRASFASSRLARAWGWLLRVTAPAWRASSLRTAIQDAAGRLPGMTAPHLIRVIAVAIAVAAVLQPLLMRIMPLAVRPAVPAYAFVAIALIATVAAWRPEAIAAAWPASWIGRCTLRR